MKRSELVRSYAVDVGEMPMSINGEDVVFHEVVQLSPAKLEEKELKNGASRVDSATNRG